MKNIFKGINLVLILKKRKKVNCNLAELELYGRPHLTRQAKPHTDHAMQDALCTDQAVLSILPAYGRHAPPRCRTDATHDTRISHAKRACPVPCVQPHLLPESSGFVYRKTSPKLT